MSILKLNAAFSNNLGEPSPMKSILGFAIRSFRDELSGTAVVAGEYFISHWMLKYASHQALLALAVAGALYAVAFAAPVLPSAEWTAFAASAVLLGYALYFLKAAPDVLRWIVLAVRLRLPPRQLLRLAVYRGVMDLLAEGLRRIDSVAESRAYVRWGYKVVSMIGQVPHEEAAWTIADSVERRFWPVLGKAALFGLAPILGVVVVFRSVITHGNLLDQTAHLTALEAVAYPVAALIDLMSGSELRTLLTHR